MIQFPRRSVTRFFIPLIDVLTLLFCIFLLMPMFKATPEAQEPAHEAAADLLSGEAPAPPKEEQPRPDAGNLEREREQLAQLRREKIDVLQQRLYIRVLDIDADTGKLFYREPEGARELAAEADALDLIARHKREAGSRELYYLFLFPRRLTGYPEQRQLERYNAWFKTIAHGTDNPLSER